jgi:hypothetical protein
MFYKNFIRCSQLWDSSVYLRRVDSIIQEDPRKYEWGIQSPKVIETWDPRIKLLKEVPMFRGFKKGYSFGMKYGLWISDFLNIMSMVHLRIDHT